METLTADLGVKQVPSYMAIPGTPNIYPKVEELTFRTYVTSEDQARRLLIGIQALVNAIGAEPIIQVVSAIEKNPSLLSKAMSYLPTLMKFV